jgi:hypothetical protein
MTYLALIQRIAAGHADDLRRGSDRPYPLDPNRSAFGLVSAVQAFANLAASAVAGALWTTVSARAAFVYLAGWSTVALVAFGVRWVRNSRPNVWA